MKLRKVTIKNFRAHKESTLDVKDVSFAIIRGANGSGKSSIGQGISLNLTGTTMGLSSDGKGFAEKVAQGEKQAVITTEIQGQHILEKTVTLGMTSRNEVVKCLDAPDEKKFVKGFENFLSRYSDALKIALNTDYFTRMGEKEQKSLLAKLVLPSRYDFPQEKVELVNSLMDDPIDFTGEPFAVIELAYKKLYKERESINRDVKNFVIPDDLPIPQGVNSESLQNQLTEIRGKRETLQKERDSAVSKAHTVEVERVKLQTTLNNLRARLDEGKKKIASIGENILSDDDLKKHQNTASRSKELEKLKKEHDGFLEALRTVNQQIERLREIQDKGATCPTCDQNIDSARIEKLITDFRSEISDADARLQKIDKKIKEIGDCSEAENVLNKHEQAIKEKEALTKELSQVVAEGKKTKELLGSLAEEQDATLPFNDPLGNLQEKESEIIKQLTPVITAEQRAKEIKTKTVEFEKLESKAKTLQELVTYFDKDGIKKVLVGQYIGGFESKLNCVLSAWGYKASLSDDLSSFDVETPRGYKGPVRELSGAEEHIFKIAFQCAVSSASGIKLVVIDEVEELGEDIRQNLYRACYGLIQKGSLDQAIMIGYSLDKTVPSPKAEGSAYYFVENGEVGRIG